MALLGFEQTTPPAAGRSTGEVVNPKSLTMDNAELSRYS
jgi:hypothetical protein